MSSDVENDSLESVNFPTMELRKSYDIIVHDSLSDDANEDVGLIERSKIGRRYTHDLGKNNDVHLEDVDPNMLDNNESDVEKAHFNTFVIKKARKIQQSPRKSTTQPSTIPKPSVVSSSGDSVTSKLNMTRCSLEAEKEMENLLRSENVSLHKQLESSKKKLDDMRSCVIEYEKTIQELKDNHDYKLSEKSQNTNNVVLERDQAIQDLNTIEKAFTDLQRRFEKSKEVIESLYKNEEVLKKHAENLKEELTKSEGKYHNLKLMTERRLKRANEEVEAAKRQNEAEIARLLAVAKKAELKISSLEKQLNQKTEENQELTKICDELISTYSNDTTET